MTIKPYLLVPKLIPQPTWGGTYIATNKGLPQATFSNLKIGQSYELATDSMLSTVERSELLPLEIANASDGKTEEVIGDRTTMFSLQDLINQDPIAILGKKVVDAHGTTMQVLIKFTQAKGNSFQVHIRPGFPVGHWKAKPESWYYFEKGKATLGLKKPVDIEKYKGACKAIETKALEVSEKIKSGQLLYESAQKELAECIATQNPFQYVNEVMIEPNMIIDLSDGGVHHSWEEGPEIPDGNILYEVQLNVMDKDCTLRSFDKGKIGNDGSLRPIHIDEYFQALNGEETANDPAQYMRTPQAHSEDGINVTKLFNTLHYSSDVLEFAGQYQGKHADTSVDQSFHHLFVKEGQMRVTVGTVTLLVTQGASVFIPAQSGQYTLISEKKAVIIKTWQ